MSSEILKVIEELGREIERLARLVLAEHGISDKSELYQNVKVQIDASSQPIVIDTFFNNYIQYIEAGRKPMTGKQPPIDELRDWAQERGLPTDNSTLYAISHAIWRDGIEGKPILATLEQRVEEYMQTEFYDQLSEAIINELNKYFE